MAHFVARYASTSLDVIEHWQPEKLIQHFNAALRLHRELNGNPK